jgi:hypothetical protein
MSKIISSDQYAGILETVAGMCDGLQDRRMKDYTHIGDYFPCVKTTYAVGVVCGSLSTMVSSRGHDFKNTSFRMRYFTEEYAKPTPGTSTQFMCDKSRPLVRFDNFYLDYFKGSSLRGAPIISPHWEDPQREELAQVIKDYRFIFLLGANRWNIERTESLALTQVRLKIAEKIEEKIGNNVPTEIFLIGLVGNAQQTKKENEDKTGVLVKVPFFRIYARELSKKSSAQGEGAQFQKDLGRPERDFLSKVRLF